MLFPTDAPMHASLSDVSVSGTRSEQPFVHLAMHALAYWRWLAGAAVLGVVLTGLALSFVAPRYEAQAVVIVDSRRNKLADAEGALSSIVIDQYQSALKSELELLLSNDLARHVILSLDLLHTRDYAPALTHVPTAQRFAALRGAVLGWFGQHAAANDAGALPQAVLEAAHREAAPAPPGQEAALQAATKIFAKAFWAENDPKSLTIRLGYKSGSPVLAAAVTNAALQRYLAADEEMKSLAIEHSEAWLSRRITGLRADLDQAEHAVEDFRASHALATNRDRSPLQQQLLQLQSRQIDARAELAAVQAKVARNRQDGEDGVAADTDALGSRLIQALRTREAALLTQQADLSAVELPDNPDLLKVRDQLAQLRRTITTEVARMARSDFGGQHLAEMRLADVSSAILAVQGRIDAENAADIRLRSLQADAASKRTVLDSFTQRYDRDAGAPLTTPDSRVVSWASVPVDPASPQYGLVLAGGTLASCALAFGLSLGKERLRRGFGGVQELEEELGIRAAGLVPALPRLAMAARMAAGAAEPPRLRDLSLTVRALAHGPATAQRRVMLVTSSVAGEGKSTLALSLARSVAGAGQSCVLIDADIRNPSLHGSLGLPAAPGLVDLVAEQAALDAMLRRKAGEQFDFLSAGRPTADTLRPFTAAGFERAMAELKRRYEVIVIDSAPVLLASETLVLAGHADLTLFLVQWRTTPREIARKAAAMMGRVSAGPCLAVLSRADLRRMGRRGTSQLEERYRTAYQIS